MDRNKILERKKQLETQRDQIRGTLGAYEGAIQDCDYWLAEMDKPIPEETTSEE